jgi:exosortase
MKTVERTVIYRKNKYISYYIVICIVFILLYYPYFNWLIEQWKYNYNNTFGYLVPLVSGWIIYAKRRDIYLKSVSNTIWGWVFFILGILLVIFYWWNRNAVVASLSLPIFLYGLVMIVWGKERGRLLIFPLFFLIFLYPWGDIFDSIAGFQLRLFSVNVAYFLFKCMGMEDAAISGTLLYTGRFIVDIAPACSGLTMMNVLFFMAAIGAYMYKGKKHKGLIIFLSVIPLVIILNTMRITITGITGHFWGEETAMSFYHNASGMVVFGLALLFLYWEACLFNRMDETI